MSQRDLASKELGYYEETLPNERGRSGARDRSRLGHRRLFKLVGELVRQFIAARGLLVRVRCICERGRVGRGSAGEAIYGGSAGYQRGSLEVEAANGEDR